MGPDPSDEELLRLFLDGEATAFEELMRRHEDRIFAVAYRVVGNRADALEATQDAFVAAFRRASSFRGEAAFSTWLYRIAVNACKDLLRKRRDLPLEDEAAFEAAAATSTFTESVEVRLDVAAALRRLPEEYREAVVMHDLGGVPYEEIAALTEAPLGTVKSRISRGRKMLARLMEQPAAPPASKERR